MADFEHARAMLRMAHKDFNALTGTRCSAKVYCKKISSSYKILFMYATSLQWRSPKPQSSASVLASRQARKWHFSSLPINSTR